MKVWSHVCGGCGIKRGESRELKDGGGGQWLKKWVVDLQLRTVGEGSSDPCMKGHLSRKAFCSLEAHILILYILYNNVLILYIFLICRFKINHMMELHMYIYSWVC
jgi:hypothetical protein